MRQTLLLFIATLCTLHAQDTPLFDRTSPVLNRTPPARTLWRASLTSLAVANALDVQSSWGKHELNSALASPNGAFGARGASMKFGFQGGLMALEYLILRRHPNKTLYRVLTILNFGATAATSATALHNYTIPRR